MSVSMDKGTATAVHIHVGHNIPGYLPESDVTCFESAEDALNALRHEIKDQQDCYREGCESDAPDDCECGWCNVAGDCEAALSAIAAGDMKYTFLRTCYVGLQFSPPEGADVIHWMTEIRPDRESCEIAQGQEA